MQVRKLALASIVATMGAAITIACVGDDASLAPVAPVPGTEASTSDAPVDAADAAPVPDAAKGFCERRGASHDFCADFDAVEPITEGWLQEVRGESDAPRFATVASSPPRSFRAAVRYTPDGGTDVPVSRLSYQRPFKTPGVQPALVVDFQLFLETVDLAPRNVYITGIEVPSGLSLALRCLPGDAGAPACELLVLVGIDTIGVIPGVPVGKWSHVALALSPRMLDDGGPSGGGFTVTLDAVSKSYMLPVQGLPSTLRIDVGLAVSNPIGAGWTAYFDDVLIDGAR